MHNFLVKHSQSERLTIFFFMLNERMFPLEIRAAKLG